MITIQKKVTLPIQEWRAYKAVLQRAAQATLSSLPSSPKGDITLVICDDTQIRVLNHQFRGIDEPTDVLAFPLSELNPQSGRYYLGDVVISLERAQAQAKAGGHPFIDELALLTVHGILHLCGYDHEQPAEKEQMWAKQSTVLASLGIQIPLPSE